MKNKQFIEELKIKKLFGIYDVEIPFNHKINVFVGENGLGKTTILNCINSILQFDELSLRNTLFDEISIRLLGEEIVINSKTLLTEDNPSTTHTRAHRYHDESTAQIAREYWRMRYYNGEVLPQTLIKQLKRDNPHSFYGSLYTERIIKELDKDKTSWQYKVFECMNKNKDIFDIIYLPTYRRIEEDFNKYLDDEQISDYQNTFKHSHLEFGMDDVETLIRQSCNTLKDETNNGFKEMTGQLLEDYAKIARDENVDANSTAHQYKEKIPILFERLTEKIDPRAQQTIMSTLDDNEESNKKTYLNVIINGLCNICDKTKMLDENLKNFSDTCNRYLHGKYFEYDPRKIECSLKYSESPTSTLNLKDLSSGEKQIVSLFSKIYLTQSTNKIILFDEPELSLSLPWQKQLMPDIVKSDKCSFMIAITHSPFIFDNDISKYTRDIRPYITLDKKA